MTDKNAKRISDLQQQYEDALDKSRKNPKDDKAHAQTITLAQKLAETRQDVRVDEVKRGVRSGGVAVRRDED